MVRVVVSVRGSLNWLELVRVMVRHVTGHRCTRRMLPVRMVNLVQFRLGVVTAYETGLRSGSHLWFWLQLGLGLETLLFIDARGRTRRILPVPGISGTDGFGELGFNVLIKQSTAQLYHMLT